MKKILITGALGEVGQGLVNKLKSPDNQIVAIDINKPNEDFDSKEVSFHQIDITDEAKIAKLFDEHEFDTVFHLAALLSTSAEKDPGRAHIVNTDGTFNLLSATNRQGSKLGKKIKFIFPSSIAVYGMSSVSEKSKYNIVKEDQFLDPITMYGVNKLYCENLGKYYSTHFQLLTDHKRYLDFRCIRFPGLLSAFTLPTGGTSDYAPEMIHSAAKGEDYNCFVRPDSTIGFMAMPDAVRSLIELESVESSWLKSKIYNVTGFSASAKDFENEVKKYYPKTIVNYVVDEKRQRIVDSWPMDTDDSLAQTDWNWKPEFDFTKTFSNYLIPNIKY